MEIQWIGGTIMIAVLNRGCGSRDFSNYYSFAGIK
jgi:hypothetical protein